MQLKHIAFTSLLLSIALFSSSCDKTDDDMPIVESNYPTEVARIIETNCATDGCHAGENPQENLDLTTWEKMFEGSDYGAMAIPYNTNWSHFFQHINTYEDLGIRATPVMPPSPASPLSRDDVTIIQDWLAAGALNDEGEYKWTTQEAKTNGKLFALCAGSDLVAVSDLESNLIMRFIEVGQLPGALEAPHYITISPDGQYFYVSLINGSIIEKYRTDDYSFVGRASVGSDPALIVTNEDGSRVAVTHWNDTPGQPKLTLLNGDDMSVLYELTGSGDLISFAHGLQAKSDFSELYITANTGNYIAICTLNGNRDEVVDFDQIPVEAGESPQPSVAYKPYQLYLSDDESQLFISCNAIAEVRVMDVATQSIIHEIPVGASPRLMDYDPVSNRLFVACQQEPNSQSSLEGCVSVIDLGTMTEVARIGAFGQRPHGVSVAVNARKLYVSTENTGGVDPPHHPLEGNSAPPGKYHVIDLNTLEVIDDDETELAENPNALIAVE